MSLLFQTGFDHYTTVLDRWNSITGNDVTIQSSQGRNSSKALRINRFSSGQSSSAAYRSLPTNYQTIYFAFAMRWPTLPSGGEVSVAQVLDGSTAQLTLKLDWLGVLRFYRSTSTLLGTVPSFNAVANVWYHFEWKAKISTTVGEIELRINEVDHAISGSGSLNTQASANAYSNVIALTQLEQGTNGGTVYFDDVVVRDDAFSGDVEVLSIFPDGIGTTDQWTATGAATTAAATDEAAPNGDTDYASTANVGDLTLHTFQDIPTTSTIQAVVAMPYVKKTDAGTAKIKSTTRSGGTNYDGAEQAPSDASYAYFPHIWETDPNTGSAWTASNLNSAEFGFKRTA